MWIVFRQSDGAGLDRLDPQTGVFTHYRYQPGNPASLSNDSVTALLEDRDGNIWVGTEYGGLNCFDPKTNRFIHYRHSANPFSLSNDEVRVIYEDREGTIWAGTGYSFIEQGDGGLNRLDKKTGKITRYLHDPKNPQSLINNKVRAIFEDSRGTFWVGTAGDGLHTMDRSTGNFVRHRYDPAQPGSLSRPPLKKLVSWVDDHISFITEDSAGMIWIGTFSGGINRYDPFTKKLQYFHSTSDSLKNDLVPTNLWRGFISSEGVLWITSFQGIFRFDPLRKNIPYFKITDPVRSIFQDSSGMLWLGTNNGLLQYDRNSGISRRFLHEPANHESLTDDFVNQIYQDRAGTLWVVGSRGFNPFDLTAKTFAPGKFKMGNTAISEMNASYFHEDKAGNFWIGGSDFSGLAVLNRQTDTFSYYSHNDKDSNSLSNNGIQFIEEDNSGNIWLAAYRGLNLFDPVNNQFKRYLPGKAILSFWTDSEGIIWVGTNRGLYRSDSIPAGFSLFIDWESGISENLNVQGILEDNHKGLWIRTHEALLRLNPERNQISAYSMSNEVDIFNSSTQANSFKSKSGELFFGNGDGKGFYAFFPEQFIVNSKAPRIVFSGFRLGSQLVIPGINGPLHVPLDQTKDVYLNYNQNVFSIDFAGIHYVNPEENRHLFKLENLDNDWRKAGEEKTAYYYNVPPGKYIFRVKAANSDGVWAERSFNIFIAKPWWRTWQAYTLYALLFIALVIVTDRIQRKRLINKERARAKDQELAQAKEIEKAFHELKTTQAQLIQSEKMASLGELTAGIAHEIQNPLNFVNNFSEVSNELLDEMKIELSNGSKEDAIAIADDVKQNLEKILHHGKRADAIVKGMLQHSRSSSGVKELTDINKLADEYLRLSYHGLRAKDKSFNATIKSDLDESIGKINIIPQDIGRVVLNLINNAFYAVNEKKQMNIDGYEPTVSVNTKKIGNKVEISVRDNGNGIPQKVVDKIFQPFFTTKPTGQGTGLGLSLSYDIIKAHGGEIKVETKEEEGSEFIIQLPVN